MNIEEPNNAEAEKWLLGAILDYPKLMAQFTNSLSQSDFYTEKNGQVWKAMQTLQKDNRPIDILTVGTLLKDVPGFSSIFGENDYLFMLQESNFGRSNADYYLDLILKASSLRQLIAAMRKTIGEAFYPAADADALMATAMERISGIASKSACAEDEHLADTVLRFLDNIRSRMEKGLAMGIQTGFYHLDHLTGGLRPGELVITGARTGVGKTSFALSVALNVAKSYPVKFFSLEVKENQLAPRVASFLSQVNMQRTLNAKISESELACQYEAAKILQSYNIYVEFKTKTIEKILAESHAFSARHGAGLIIIDHLHFIKTSEKTESRNIELGKFTRALKDLAGDINCPVLLLSQLNREIDRAAAKDKKPRLSDLRDSGNIEQDADMVWFINRPFYYNANLEPSDTDIIVAKNRSGPTGETKLHFDTNTTKFSDPQYSSQTGGML
jgi:replicative DNA helicase